MQTLDQHLVQLYLEGAITAEEGLAKASNPDEFARRAGLGELMKGGCGRGPGRVASPKRRDWRRMLEGRAWIGVE